MDAPPVQYVRTRDYYDIAYAVSGEGRPLIFPSPNLHNMQQLWRFFPDWMEGLASRFRLIQYDSRGEGMSSRGLPEAIDIDHYTRDIEAIVDRLQLDRFSLWAFGGKGLIAVRYAARHRENVEALILSTVAASGSAWMPVFYKMLPNENWESFLRAITPAGLTTEEAQERVREYHNAVYLDDWNTWMQCVSTVSIEQDLTQLSVPVLVLHPRNFRSLSADEPRKVATMVPNARFALIDGEHGYGDARQGLAVLDGFLADIAHQATQTQAASGLSSREVEVLRLLAAGKSNQDIADELVISLNTVRRHVSNIFDKTGVANRAQAAVYAKDHGLA
jgi:DNA-binding CsgD family transcriptional regulator/pimeloyl-ACP methyl ester carboxylesterase